MVYYEYDEWYKVGDLSIDVKKLEKYTTVL